MFVMAEIAAGLVTRNDGRKYVTLDSSFRFLRGSSAKELRGVAKITKRGKTVCFTKSQVMESELQTSFRTLLTRTSRYSDATVDLSMECRSMRQVTITRWASLL